MTTAQLIPAIHYLRRLGAAQHAEALTDDHLLLCFARERDQQAFSLLVWRHGPLVWGLCRRLLSDWHDAEDAFQATFMVLARKAGSIGQPERLAAWLYGVARRTALKMRAAAVRRRGRQESLRDGVAPAGAGVEVDLAAVLAEEIGRLPELLRAPFVLCHVQGQTTDQAARLLGWPRGTVATRIARARQALRDRLTQRGLALSAGALAGMATPDALTASPPSPLVEAAVGAALQFVSGRAAGVSSAAGTVIAKGVLNSMFWNKLKAVVLVLVVAGVGSGGLWQAAHTQKMAVTEEAGSPREGPMAAVTDPSTGAVAKGAGQHRSKVRLGSAIIEASAVVTDAERNQVQVTGPGRLRIQALTTLWGQELARPAELTICWRREMHFNGKDAQFHGGVAAEQGETRLACQTMEISLDRLLSLTRDQAGQAAVKVERLVCDQSCRIEDSGQIPARLCQSLEAEALSVKLPHGIFLAAGPGLARSFQFIRPAGASTPGGTAAEWEQMNVRFQGRMFASNQARTVAFYDSVEVVSEPIANPDLPAANDRLSSGGWHLRCEILKVRWDEDQDGRPVIQGVEARGKAQMRTATFWGDADVIKYDEVQDVVVLTANEGNQAMLYHKGRAGDRVEEIKGKKISCWGKTNEIKVEGAVGEGGRN